jgi:hypothetical protein
LLLTLSTGRQLVLRACNLAYASRAEGEKKKKRVALVYGPIEREKKNTLHLMVRERKRPFQLSKSRPDPSGEDPSHTPMCVANEKSARDDRAETRLFTRARAPNCTVRPIDPPAFQTAARPEQVLASPAQKPRPERTLSSPVAR